MSSAVQDYGPPSFRELVAEEVRAHLARRRISGRELSRRLGEAVTWASRRLTGEVAFSTDDLDRIAAVLRMTPQQLLAGIYSNPAVGRETAGREATIMSSTSWLMRDSASAPGAAESGELAPVIEMADYRARNLSGLPTAGHSVTSAVG
jgi:transcriptional regulator with XRE-family HTH domain